MQLASMIQAIGGLKFPSQRFAARDGYVRLGTSGVHRSRPCIGIDAASNAALPAFLARMREYWVAGLHDGEISLPDWP
jgi:hypothetical protein